MELVGDLAPESLHFNFDGGYASTWLLTVNWHAQALAIRGNACHELALKFNGEAPDI